MMNRCATKRLNKKCPSQDASEGRVKDDNFNKIRNVFEISRPNKSPNSTLTESKSTPSFSRTLSCFEEKIKSNKETTFLRNSSSRASIRSISKHKKVNYRPTIEPKPKDIEKTNAPVDFGRTIKKDSGKIIKVNEIFAHGNHDKYDKPEARRGSADNTLENKFVKNDKPAKTTAQFYANDSSTPSTSESRTKSSKEITAKSTKDINSFIEAEFEGETETYRKSLVLEMDLELAKMKLDGFIDDDDHDYNNATLHINPGIEEVHHYRKVERYKQLFEGMSHEFEMFQNEYESGMDTESNIDEQQSPYFSKEDLTDYQKEDLAALEAESSKDESDLGIASTDDVASGISKDVCDSSSVHSSGIQKRESNLDDEFCESLGDDLENGSFFVEAYNDEGRELVIVEISIERRTVSLDKPYSLESIQNSFKNADMVFQQTKDKTLNVINDPTEFIHENSQLVSYGPHSNRSTLYSITSRDSDIFDTDDEGISVEQRNGTDDVYNNVRRETFCDHQGIVRIERIGYPEAVNSPTFEEGMEPQSPVSRNDSFTQKGQLSYIIDEIKATEKKYVEDLHKAVNRYMPYIERHTPPNLIGTACYIFGNLPKILEHQRRFLEALDNCGDDIQDVVKTFIHFERLFELYPNYFKNKPKADAVLREFTPVVKKAQERFKERLDLSAYLLTPLQRLGKYKLFLESIEKQLTKLELPTGNATMALEIIKREMSKGNDFVAIESIENSPISKLDYGSFKMREKFNILKPRRLESMVFLFDNIIVFTLCNQNNMERYHYWDSIKMNDLRIATFEDLTMHLTDFTKCKKTSRTDKYTYVLEAKTEKIRATWRKAIEDMLWQQLLNVKEKTLKLYQKRQKEGSSQRRNRIKSTGSSTFYVTI